VTCTEGDTNMVENKKVMNTFRGKVTRNRYNFVDNKTYDKSSYMGKPYICEFTETERRETIAECEVIRPPFEDKETVYIPEIERYTTIEKVARSIDGSIYYNVTYIIKELGDNEESLKEKDEAEAKLKYELIEYEKYLDKEKEEKLAQFASQIKFEEEKGLEVLYIEPTYNFKGCSIVCYYGNRKYTYEDVTISNLEEMLKGSCYLGIEKENTLIYIDAKGIGTWIYDALSSRGYNIKSTFASKKVMTK
jgi:hypothetical protein